MDRDQAATMPVGSGAYRFVEWIRDDRLVMEKVDGHPLAAAAGFDRIVWRVIPEASTRAAELIAGNVDIVANVSPDQAGTIDASGARLGAVRRRHAPASTSASTSARSSSATAKAPPRSRTCSCAAR